MIKVVNKRIRIEVSKLFHYAHFIADCLFPEIIHDIYNYNNVCRPKTLNQTIGNFSKIYEDVMKNKNNEIIGSEFNNLNGDIMLLGRKEKYIKNINNINKFRNFIFARYIINPLTYYESYPEIILIKRGRVDLVDDAEIKMKMPNRLKRNGLERREITEINQIEAHLLNKYQGRFKSFYLENMPFQQQVKIFNNAKMIVLAHGAALINMFFCKEGTTIIEVTCNKNWPFFDRISNKLNLNHIKVKNELQKIMDIIHAQ